MKTKTKKLITSVAVGLIALGFVRAATITNTTFYFDNSTGNIVTQQNVFASPALFSITNGYFFDAGGGNYCVLVSSNLPTSYQVCSNLIWTSIVGTTTNGPFTNRTCQTLSSNITVQGRYFVNGSYPRTNKATAVKTGP